jgi:DEAD/DEAH box helicase domain-containing protein
LYPAKALAYDQLGNLQRMVEAGGLADSARPACYDGDTPTHRRPGIRRSATILLSNPDMLHQGILPYHAKWAGLFARLKYVVLDEIHSYRGIFGSHVAGVIRRLQRVCRHYGSSPQFICCSATLGNPRELAERLTNRPVRLIDNDGSPQGRKHIVLWNPPWLDADQTASRRDEENVAAGAANVAAAPRGSRGRAEDAFDHLRRPQGADATSSHAAAETPNVAAGPRTGRNNRPEAGPPPVRIARRSGNVEAQELMLALLQSGAGTIAFAKARVVAELIYKFVVEALAQKSPDLAARVRSYRGGYLPSERREIEQALFSGRLLGVCSTNALELGIDVGALDAAIIVGFPGTFCSLWQQAGRAGRRRDESLVFFVAYDDPVDQYLMRNPRFVFDRPIEHAVVDPSNPHILAAQLGCAARELPLVDDELPDFGVAASQVAQVLVDEGKLHRSGRGLHFASAEFAQARTNLRTISDATYAIVNITDGRNEVLGQVDSISAPELVYPEAVYLHQGESYVVRELDQQTCTAKVERFDADYYTQPMLASECRIVREQMAGEVLGGARFFGDVVVKWQTVAFRKFKFYTMELIGQTKLELDPLQIETTALWLQPPKHARQAVAAAGHKPHEALAGVRNLLLVSLPPLAMCDRHDIGGIVDSAQLGEPTIFLYDRYEGGVGYARHGYEHIDDLLRMACELVVGCECDNGCPGCVGPPNLRPPIHHDPDLSGGYAIPDKRATIQLLRSWGGSFTA